jgi:tetratricopeptide (TPR) repeat protein/transcriptional regulator with XRE-family HTH domain
MGGKTGVGANAFGELLRRHRGAQGLTQEELAERAGLHAQEISKLERGIRRAPRSTTVEFLAEALQLDAQQKDAFIARARGETAPRAPSGQGIEPGSRRDASIAPAEAEALVASIPTDALPPRAPLPPGSRMPLAPNPLFVGRSDDLLLIAAALRGGDTTVALGPVVASTGLGGLGKTQLAVELVHRYGRFFAGGVFWLGFASADEIALQVAACAGPGAMDLAPGVENLPVEERVQRVQRAWQSAVPRLLVFDNCEEEGLLDAWRPTSGGCRVLVTSRRCQWSPTLGVTALPLDLLPRPDSIGLLRRYRLDLAPDDPVLDAIAGELGDLPLALHLAGSHLRAYRAEVSLDGYLAELRRSEVVRHASLLGDGLDDSPSPTRHVQSLAQTFAFWLGRLEPKREVDQVAIALLARIACLAPGEAVSRDLLGRTLKEVEPRRLADGLRRLAAVGLMQEGEGWLRLHRLLVHFVRQEEVDPMAQPAVNRALIDCGTDALRRHLNGSELAGVIPHLVEVARSGGGGTGDERVKAELCNAAGLALRFAADLRAARPWYERALDIRERVLGPDHPDTAFSLSALAELLHAQGELAAARPLLERALAIRERVLGPDHPDTAMGFNNLGLLHWAQGELAASRPLLERAVAIRERVLGTDHRYTGESLNYLGLLLRDQGELAAATLLFERVRAIWERVLGPDHPHTAYSLNNLAVVLTAQGELDAARPLFERALDIRERVLGPDHPDTATSLDSLASLLRDQGELDAARALHERALDIREHVLGPDHPDTAISLNGMARLLWDQGELAAARTLCERALGIRERMLGPDHPRTATCLTNLALVLNAQGELDAARPLFERATDIRERVLGPDHPDTASSLNGMAHLLRDQGELAAARTLCERALAIRERMLGPDHPDTAVSLNDLALLRRAQGELAAARPLVERALDIREKVLGPDHPRTAESLNNLALLHRDKGRLDAARPLVERALAIRERVLGPDHPDTVATRRALERLAAEGGGAGADA